VSAAERLDHLVTRRARVTFRSDLLDAVVAWLILTALTAAAVVSVCWLFGHPVVGIVAAGVGCAFWAVVAWADVVGDERLITRELARRAEEDEG
jgi:hypothetical protein